MDLTGFMDITSAQFLSNGEIMNADIIWSRYVVPYCFLGLFVTSFFVTSFICFFALFFALFGRLAILLGKPLLGRFTTGLNILLLEKLVA